MAGSSYPNVTEINGHRCRLHSELEGAFTTTLEVLSSAMGAKDAYTASHEDSVAELAMRIAGRMGLSPREQETVRYAALLHDIGKIAVPDHILGKPGQLSEDEWEVMRAHTIVGADMLKRIPFFSQVHPLVRSSSRTQEDSLAELRRCAGTHFDLTVVDALHVELAARGV